MALSFSLILPCAPVWFALSICCPEEGAVPVLGTKPVAGVANLRVHVLLPQRSSLLCSQHFLKSSACPRDFTSTRSSREVRCARTVLTWRNGVTKLDLQVSLKTILRSADRAHVHCRGGAIPESFPVEISIASAHFLQGRHRSDSRSRSADTTACSAI